MTFPRDIEMLLEDIEALDPNGVVALAAHCPGTKVMVFDIVADAGLAMSRWHEAWTAASQAVHEVALRSRRADVHEAALRAGCTAGAAAVALLLSAQLSPADYERLFSGWRASMRAVSSERAV